MKNSETDKDEIDLIKETLGDYEEQYILGSWENFVRKRSRKRKLILWITASGIAASLIIGSVALDLLQTDSRDIINKGDQITSVTPDIKPGRQVTADSDVVVSESSQTSNTFTENRSGKSGKEINVSPLYVADNVKDTDSAIITATGRIENATVNRTITDGAEGRLSRRETESSDSLKDENQKVAPENGSSSRMTDLNVKEETPLTTEYRGSRFRFGVNVAPGVTTTNTSSAFSYSGGVNADYKLSKSFFLSAGLQVEHRSIVSETTDNPSWIPPGETRADLVNLDLPLNVIWKFLNRKSASYYLAGGISSVVSLSEKYSTTTYTQKISNSVEMVGDMPKMTYELETVKTTEQTTEPALNTFDFAGRINIIFGFEQKVSSGLSLHLEPYLKIPLTDLEGRDFNYTMSGLSCKITF